MTKNKQKSYAIHVSKELHDRLLKYYMHSGEYMSSVVSRVMNKFLDEHEADTKVQPAVEKFNG